MALEERIPATETNRGFSRLLRGVRERRSYVVTAHGRAIARLVPIREAKSGEDRMREAAKRELLCRLKINRLSISAGGRGMSFTISEGCAGYQYFRLC
jgi:prevent-host-death family protein